jgi:hypothetical protein
LPASVVTLFSTEGGLDVAMGLPEKADPQRVSFPDTAQQSMCGTCRCEPLRPRRRLAAKLISVISYLGDIERPVAGRGEEIGDPAFDGSRSLAHRISSQEGTMITLTGAPKGYRCIARTAASPLVRFSPDRRRAARQHRCNAA